MDIQQIIHGLRSHNAWRRGEKPYGADDWSAPYPPPHSSKQLGELLDSAIKVLENAARQHEATWAMAIKAASQKSKGWGLGNYKSLFNEVAEDIAAIPCPPLQTTNEESEK